MFYSPTMTRNMTDYKVGADIESANPKFTGQISPDDIPNMFTWYAADSLSYVDNDPVLTWDNINPDNVNNDAYQATLADRPTFKTNIINGLPAVRFDGGTEHMDILDGGFSTTTGFTAFFVIKSDPTDAQENRGILSYTQASTYDYEAGNTLAITTGFISAGVPSGFNTIWRGAGSTNITTTFKEWRIFSHRVEDAGGGDVTVTNRNNGTQIESKTFPASATNGAGIRFLGARADNNSGGTLGGLMYFGDMAEVIVYEDDIGTGNVEGIETYLNNKYAIY